MFLYDNDMYGYYAVGSLKTYSKKEAIEWADSYNTTPTWHFNDEVFSSYDWTTEPTKSINDLYRERAQQLREKYDYIVLLYSGGWDSTNMLYAFLDNNILVDEICTFYSRHDTISPQYLEIQLFTNPKLDIIKQKYPNQKIRKLDYADAYNNWHKIINDKFDYSYYHNGMFTANRLITNRLDRWVDDYRNLVKTKNVAFLWACDKPIITLDDNQFAVRFKDTLVDASVGANIQFDKIESTHEMFYWSPELPQMVIKQAHLVKNYCRSGGKITQTQNGTEIDFLSIKNVIYPRCASELFFEYKSPTMTLLGNRDQWFFAGNNDASSFWKTTMVNHIKSINKKWLRKEKDTYAIKAWYSKPYHI